MKQIEEAAKFYVFELKGGKYNQISKGFDSYNDAAIFEQTMKDGMYYKSIRPDITLHIMTIAVAEWQAKQYSPVAPVWVKILEHLKTIEYPAFGHSVVMLWIYNGVWHAGLRNYQGYPEKCTFEGDTPGLAITQLYEFCLNKGHIDKLDETGITPVAVEPVNDFYQQVKDHIKGHNLINWDEALTDEEMLYLENLLLTFNPVLPVGSVGNPATVAVDKSAEEILRKHLFAEWLADENLEVILEAMEEYAKQFKPIVTDKSKDASKEAIIQKWIYHTPLIDLKEAVSNAMEEYAQQFKPVAVQDNNK